MFKLGCLNISTFLFHSSKSTVWNLLSLASNSSDFSVWGYVPYRGLLDSQKDDAFISERSSGVSLRYGPWAMSGPPPISVQSVSEKCFLQFEMVEKKIQRTIFQGILHKIQI